MSVTVDLSAAVVVVVVVAVGVLFSGTRSATPSPPIGHFEGCSNPRAR
jgi:hypothetical protein